MNEKGCLKEIDATVRWIVGVFTLSGCRNHVSHMLHENEHKDDASSRQMSVNSRSQVVERMCIEW